MIMKLRDNEMPAATDRLAIAGAKAEDQMAFYLKRAFEHDPDVTVFNDLRLANDRADDFAQIDHLILFPKGLIVIESKSVTSAVRVNKLGEWERQWDGYWKGFSSPVQQAKRQIEFLQVLLRQHKARLRDTKLFGTVKMGFGMFPMDYFIAISDGGTIKRDGDHLEVVKADQVADKIRETIKKRDISFLKWAVKSNDEEKWDYLNKEENIRLSLFLLSRHTTRVESPAQTFERTARPVPKIDTIPVSKTAQIKEEALTQLAPRCSHCHSARLQILYGFTYYFKCLDCTKNSKIDMQCSACSALARIRKQKREFFRECGCGKSELYYTNAE